MFVNRKLGELNIKIVYYGPALGGKTTNLEYIHASVDPKLRGELVSLKTQEDRTLFFDFLQLGTQAQIQSVHGARSGHLCIHPQVGARGSRWGGLRSRLAGGAAR